MITRICRFVMSEIAVLQRGLIAGINTFRDRLR